MTSKDIIEQYWVLGKNLSECAKVFGVSEETFRRRMISLNIPRRPKTVNFGGWNKGVPLPEEQKKRLSDIRKSKYRSGELQHWNKGKRWSIDVRRKISEGLLDGREPAESYYGPGWQVQRTSRLQIDEYTCQQCGSKDKLEVHHWEPFRFSYDNSLENLVTLCFQCHRGKHLTYSREGWTKEAEKDFYEKV